MKLQRTSPLREEVALSGEDFGDDIGRGGRGGGRGRGRGGGRSGGGRGGGGRGGRGRGGRPPKGRGRMRSHEDEELEEEEEELAGRKERRSRRKLRKKQRGQRKGLRSKQKLKKLRSKSKSSRSGKRGGRRGGQSSRRPERTSSQTPSRSNAPSDDQPLNSPEELDELPVEEWEDEADDWEDETDDWEDEAEDDWDDAEDDWDELEEEYLEGTYAELGAAIEMGRIRRGDAKRIFANVQANIRHKRQKLQDRRKRKSFTAPSSNDGWGPVAKLNSNIRIQAGNGHRAAVMELRPGLYVVADVSEAEARPTDEGGIAGVLPILMARGASNALQAIVQNRREQRRAEGAPRRLWDKQRNNPVLNPPTQPHLSPMSQTTQLSGAIDIGKCSCWTRKEDI